MLSKVASNIKESQAVQKKQYDKRRAVSVYDVGDHVLVKNLVRQDRKGGHITERWNGPYKVSRSYGKNVYQIASDDGKVLKKKVNSCNLKPYIDQDATPPPTKRQKNLIATIPLRHRHQHNV